MLPSHGICVIEATIRTEYKYRAAQTDFCLRSHHVENTDSLPITEVKQRQTRFAWEYRVL